MSKKEKILLGDTDEVVTFIWRKDINNFIFYCGEIDRVIKEKSESISITNYIMSSMLKMYIIPSEELCYYCNKLIDYVSTYDKALKEKYENMLSEHLEERRIHNIE